MHGAKDSNQKPTAPVQLPLDRVRQAGVFGITGIVLYGPLIFGNKS